eukprot:950211-Pleurochrysis_carterae.AAC.1
MANSTDEAFAIEITVPGQMWRGRKQVRYVVWILVEDKADHVERHGVFELLMRLLRVAHEAASKAHRCERCSMLR